MSSISEDQKAMAFMGYPVLFQDVCLIYSRTWREIFDRSIGISKFYSYLNTISGSRPVKKETDVEEEAQEFFDILGKLSNLQFLFFELSIDKNFETTAKDAFKFFTGEEVLFLPDERQIVVGPIEEHRVINEENFTQFCNLIKELYWLEVEDILEINPNDDEKVRAIKEKIKAGREARAKAKKKHIRESEEDISVTDLIASLAIKIPGMNVLNIWDMSYYAFYDQLKRFNFSEEYDMNIRAALAGAKVEKKKLRHWIRNVKSEEE